MKNKVSVIIPTFNEAETIARTIRSVQKIEDDIEIIVVDGGSSDATVQLAESCQVTVLQSLQGRGVQLSEGAKIAGGDIFWFLHSDTIPEQNAVQAMRTALKNKETVGGNFTIRFAGSSRAAKFLTRLYPHLRKIGLLYGDSAIFVRREAYQKAGGFKDLRLFEDLEFVNRLKKQGKLAYLSANVETSSRRFEGRSFALTFLRWSIFQGLYWIGVNPDFLAERYYPIRSKSLRDNFLQ